MQKKSMRAIWILATVAMAACSESPEGTGSVPDAAVASSPDASPALPDAAPASPDAAGPTEADGGTPGFACSLDEVQPIFECVLQNCAEDLGDQAAMLACVTLSCGGELLSVSPECSECVLAGLSQDFDVISDECMEGDLGGGFPGAP